MEYVEKRYRGWIVLLILMFAALVLSFSSSHAAVGEERPVTINFVNFGSIQDWRAEGNKAILIETVSNRWYRAEFFSPCIALQWQESVAFVTSPRGQLNRFSSIVASGERCQFQKLDEVPDPSQSTCEKEPTQE